MWKRGVMMMLAALVMLPVMVGAQGNPWVSQFSNPSSSHHWALIETKRPASLVRTEIEYEHAGAQLRGYLVYDENIEGRRPGVMVVHEWWGLNDYAKKRADMLAELGYVAFACDVYGEPPTDDPAVAAQRARRFYDDRALFRQRLYAGLSRLATDSRADTQNLAAIGYCFGGTAVLEMARDDAPLKAVVAFHGGLSNPNPDDDANIECMVLVCNGAADPIVPMADRQAFIASMESHGVDYQFIEYGGALHAFTNSVAKVDPDDPNPVSGYQREADHRSWQHMRSWLKEAWTRR